MNLRNGMTKSCGCLRRENPSHVTHGKRHTPTYEIWKSMKARCSNPRNKSYASYGGRGITFDPAWNSFETFLADMGEKPSGLSLDRKDNDGPYSKANCRWTTGKVQCRNKRSNSGFKLDGVWKTWAGWADQGVVSQQLLRSRFVKYGWDFLTALETPPDAGRTKKAPVVSTEAREFWE
jgi:hypothetical protein